MNITLFRSLLDRSESNTIDFKREHYKIIGSENDGASSLIKDLISFANTIRNESAFIIIGVEELGTRKNLIGIDRPIDDNIIQSKIKDKINPRLIFSYENFEFDGKVFGVIEIPVRRYPEPIMPTIKMKGIEPGKVYKRHGSSNVEATAREVIEINGWIVNLPPLVEALEMFVVYSDFLKRISLNVEPLSIIITDALKSAKEMGDFELESFCKIELEGLNHGNTYNEKLLSHRRSRMLLSYKKIESIQIFRALSVDELWAKLKEEEDFHEINAYVSESIQSMEDILNNYKLTGMERLRTERSSMWKLFGRNEKVGDIPIYIYSKFETYHNAYLAVRKRLTGILTSKL